MGAVDETQVSEAQIAVHWREEEYYEPPDRIVKVANANDPAIRERFSEEHFPECFVEYAEMLTWDKKWDTILDTSNPPFWKWWVGGKLNACVNCVDRHLETRGDKNAIIWVPEPEEDETQEITYAELHRRVNEFAALLQDFAGAKTGDRVTFHLPMVPELPVAMLACARLGVIHSEVFGGFSGTACGHRMADADSTILVTMDAYYRNGELIDHKVKADEAIEAARKEGTEVEKVLVFRRLPGEYHSESPMVEGRDFFVDELLEQYKGKEVEPVSMPAEGTLFLMYTSGTTGRPKGAQHSIGGYLSYVTGTSKYYQDIHPDDTYWCFADIGWITGHSYIVYGPARARDDERHVRRRPDVSGRGAAVADRGEARRGHLPHRADDDPDAAQARPGRAGEVQLPLQDHDHGRRADRARRLALVLPHRRQGRGVDHRHLVADGERRFPRLDAAGAREDEAGQLRPGCPRRLSRHLRRGGQRGPGRLRQGGQHLHPQPVAGLLPDRLGRPRPVCGDLLQEVQPRSEEHRLARLAVLRQRRRDAGRRRLLPHPRPRRRRDQRRRAPARDEGARVGSAITVEEVAEAAAVPVIDELRGRAVEMYISLKPGYETGDEVAQKVSQAIERDIGKIARPKNVWIVADMPKTRSGKIMRRVIASISNFADVGDVTTLANPEIVADINEHVRAEKVAKGDVPRELSEQELEEIKAFGQAE